MRAHRPLLVLLLLASACGDPADPALSSESAWLAVAGPWDPPATTRAVANHQLVDVVDPPAVSPAGYCTSSNAFACSCVHPECSPAHPGTVELDRFLRARYPYLSSGGLFCCRQNSARTSVPKLSVHAIGRAIDLMVPMEGSDADNALGDPVVNWLVENAEFIGVQRIVWDKAYWNGERGFGLLSSASSPHTNHIHLELSLDGAAMRTPFFTSGAYAGACAPRCEAGMLITGDCGATRCSDYGAECVSGAAPTCGEPPPPEPPEAVFNAGATPPRTSAIGSRTRVSLLPARRLFDSRSPAKSSDLLRASGQREGPLGAGANTWRPSASVLPQTASAAWINLAAVPQEQQGFVAVSPAAQPRPPTSALNFAPGRVRSNSAPVVLGSASDLDFHSTTAVHLIADLQAAFTPTGAGLVLDGPRRVLDTRSADAALAPGEVRTVDVGAPSGATGVVASLALIGQDAPGHAIAFPCSSPVPEVSSVNFAPYSVSSHTIVSALGEGLLCVRSHSAAHLIVDVIGYLTPDGPLAFQPLSPVRLLDTRRDESLYVGRLGARQVVEIPLRSIAGMPENAWAAAVNLTTLGSSGPGHLIAHACGGGIPHTSSGNYAGPEPTGGLTVSALGEDGGLCVFASSRTHLVVDLVGVWVHDARAPPPPPDDPDPGDSGDPPDPDPDPGTGGDPADPDPGTGGDPTDPDPDTGSDPTDPDPGTGTGGGPSDPGEAPAEPSTREDAIEGGCATAPGGTPGGPWWAIPLALALARRLRRPPSRLDRDSPARGADRAPGSR